jgi:GT2 family glycosyltransferase
MEVGVVVLNYNAYQETIRCVESLLYQREVILRIVIVDNGSQNDSASQLRDYFKDNSAVVMLSSGENLGFARGNDIGISYLTGQDIRFIFIANSDLLFSNVNIINSMINAYKPGIGLINPVVHNLDGNPETRIIYRKKLLYLRILKTFFKANGENRKKASGRSEERKKSTVGIFDYRFGVQEDSYIVTGCAFMLTPDFFAVYSGLYPETFLYCEEYATMLYLHKAGLSTCVAHTEPITHVGGASTPAAKPKIGNKEAGTESKHKIVKLMFMSVNKIRKIYGQSL